MVSFDCQATTVAAVLMISTDMCIGVLQAVLPSQISRGGTKNFVAFLYFVLHGFLQNMCKQCSISKHVMNIIIMKLKMNLVFFVLIC